MIFDVDRRCKGLLDLFLWKQAQESLATAMSIDNIKQTTKNNFKTQSSSSQVLYFNFLLQFRICVSFLILQFELENSTNSWIKEDVA